MPDTSDYNSMGDPGIFMHKGYCCSPLYVSTAMSIPMAPYDSTTVYDAVAECGPKLYTTTVTLYANAWNNNEQEVSISDIYYDTNIIVSPNESDNNYDYYCGSGIRAISQSYGTVTFKCTSVPQYDIDVNVVYWN